MFLHWKKSCFPKEVCRGVFWSKATGKPGGWFFLIVKKNSSLPNGQHLFGSSTNNILQASLGLNHVLFLYWNVLAGCTPMFSLLFDSFASSSLMGLSYCEFGNAQTGFYIFSERCDRVSGQKHPKGKVILAGAFRNASQTMGTKMTCSRRKQPRQKKKELTGLRDLSSRLS